jgi:hypothetical protein
MVRPRELREQARDFRARNVRERPAPPPEVGTRLATLQRLKEREEIHVCWCEYEGNPYLSLRIWGEGSDGQYWPDRHRGFSVRLRELPDLAEAIAAALDLADEYLANRPRDESGGRP